LKYLFLISATLFSVTLIAQDRMTKKDSLSVNLNSRVDSINSITRKLPRQLNLGQAVIDTLAPNKAVVIDSVQHTVDSLNKRIAASQAKYVDSLNSIVAKYQNKLTALVSNLSAVNNKPDTVRGKLENYSSKVDTLTKIDLNSIHQMRQLEDSINQIQSRIDSYQQKIGSGLNDKLGVIQDEVGDLGLNDKLKLPSTTGLSGVTDAIDVDNPLSGINTDISMPDLNSDAIDQVKDLNVSGNLPAIQPANIRNPVEGKVPSLSAGDLQTKIPTEVAEIKTDKITDLQNVKEDDIIEKLPVQDELKVLKDGEQVMNDQAASVKSYQNLEEYKKQTLLKSRQVVEKQLAAYKTEVDQAVSKVSQYQNRLGTILAKKGDLPKKRDPVRKLRPFERIVPGLTFQIKTTSGWLVDVNPSLRYRITSYWSAGGGWVQRFVIGEHVYSFDVATVFGPRVYSEVVIFKGISARIEAEELNVPFEITSGSYDEQRRVSLWNYVAGIKKDFSFIKRVTGNAQFMYTLYTTSNSYPYPSRFNIRFGFEYLPKKKIKKK
jgi:predicted  nucleic acid-binding Zn-ribbon protein